MVQDKDDKQQIGLTPEANEAIAKIAKEHFGDSQQDAYRFAISYAIGAGLNVDEAPQGGYVTKFNALGTLETGTSIRDMLEILKIGDPGRPFATAEKLAEIGVRDIATRLEGSETIADLLASTATSKASQTAVYP